MAGVIMLKKMKKLIFLPIMLVMLFGLAACSFGDAGDNDEGKPIDFTVVEEADLPEQLLKIINEKKANPFKLTYTNDDYLYIAQGYGAQKTGGYSVVVESLELEDGQIVFDTELIGPSENEAVQQMVTYPYVVVKLEPMDNTVVVD